MVVSQLNAGPYFCVSPPFLWCLTSIQVHKFASHLDPSTISNACKFQDVRLTSTQVPKIAPQLHSGIIYNLPSFKMFISPPLRSHLCPIQVIDSLLNSIKVTSQLIPGLVDRISAHSRPNLNAFQVSGFVSHLHPGPVPPAFKSQDSCVTSNRAPSKFHLGKNIHISPTPMSRPSRSRYSHLTTIQVTPHLDPVHDNRILDVVPLQLIQVSSWTHLAFSQVSRFASQLQPDS